ncbi:MAG: SH3 domain-containing protein [Ramlibacter sp.]
MIIRFTPTGLRHAGAPWLAALLVLAALPTAGHADDEAVVVKRASELHESPGEAGRVLAPLAADSTVTRTGDRQGPWVRVRTATGTIGWVHLFDIGPASGGGSGNGAVAGALRSVTSLFGKPSVQRTSVSTSTIGIRGLGAEDLAQAQPDVQAVARMEALRQSEAEARQFARRAALVPVGVAPLPAVPGPAVPSGNPPGGTQ